MITLFCSLNMNKVIFNNNDYDHCEFCNNFSYCPDCDQCMYCDNQTNTTRSTCSDLHYIGYFYEDNDDTISSISSTQSDIEYDVTLISEESFCENINHQSN